MFLSSPQYIQNLTIDNPGSTIDEIMVEIRARSNDVLGVVLEVPTYFPDIRLPHHVSSEEIAERTGGVLGRKHTLPSRVTEISYPQINGELFTGHFGDEETNRHPASPSFSQRHGSGFLIVDIHLHETAMILLEDQVMYVREFEAKQQGEQQDKFVSVFTLGKDTGFSHVSLKREHVTDESILRAADIASAAYKYR